ncbi:peptidoglycan DD-metalloendopeptidase family protein [Streptomyces sp. DSM 44917]|uniref:Peptidoglycan DD-metalloendopeptidase family protein n=1 Tax=Streptomyces boetiae TaxID=3075541 RepID=A0ABU2L7E8_9ACTN|nr:peptidoglycan DD-metalloendopeptidase family protein [Streptomyces sp. DSM 44917]MDT0307376.1 peptidoglycan DD-metalloendopeptidase family protein [Streptomyces sp. DSM 44917]
MALNPHASPREDAYPAPYGPLDGYGFGGQDPAHGGAARTAAAAAHQAAPAFPGFSDLSRFPGATGTATFAQPAAFAQPQAFGRPDASSDALTDTASFAPFGRTAPASYARPAEVPTAPAVSGPSEAAVPAAPGLTLPQAAPRTGDEATAEDPATTTLAAVPAPGSSSAFADLASAPDYFGPSVSAEEPYAEWNPSAESIRPVRGRHRVARQRGGTIARSRAVLGVGVMAAVGAGGMATANEGGASSVPGMGAAADTLRDDVPMLGGLLGLAGGSDAGGSGDTALATAPLSEAALPDADVAAGVTDAGEALRARILAQADHQDAEAEAEARAEAVDAAAEEAAAAAEAERAAEEERRRQAEEERERREEEERLRELRESFSLPLGDFRLSSLFGAAGSLWQANHTGLDLSAPAGTPIRNVHTGTVQEAAWAGSYGYRVIVELEDGTEVWYCHLSSMGVSPGDRVDTGDTIGNVGSTGNSTGPHLHLEIRPGESPIDPLAWLRGKGLTI